MCVFAIFLLFLVPTNVFLKDKLKQKIDISFATQLSIDVHSDTKS